MNQQKKHLLFILIASLVFYFPFLGGVHLFDWDEINFAEIAREMIVSGDYLRPQINFQTFWEKPPLFIWMQVISMKIFGMNEYAARFPNAVCGLITLITLYKIGTIYKDAKFGFYWVLAYLGSILPHLYFKSGIIDPWFNLFIFLGIYQFVLFINENSIGKKHLIFSGLFIGLAILTKGPAALLIAGLCALVYLIWKKGRIKANWLDGILFTAISIAVPLLWYGTVTLVHGTDFVHDFIVYQIRLFQTKDAGHGGFPGYHFVVLLLGCFPASAFAVMNLFSSEETQNVNFRKFMKILFWVVLILFSIVKTKIVHYSSLCYFPLTFFAASELWQILENGKKFRLSGKIILIFNALLLAIVCFSVPFLASNLDNIKPLIKDPFALLNLNADVQFPLYISLLGITVMIPVVLFLIFLKRKKPRYSVEILFAGTAINLFLIIILFIGRVEMYSQNAAIEYLKEYSSKGAIIQVHGYKSYAQLFYTQTKSEIPNVDDLLSKNYDKPIYLLCKITSAEGLESRGDLERISEKNGFVVFKKK